MDFNTLSKKVHAGLANGMWTLSAINLADGPLGNFLATGFPDGVMLTQAQVKSSPTNIIATGTMTCGPVTISVAADFSIVDNQEHLKLTFNNFNGPFSLAQWIDGLKSTLLGDLWWDQHDLTISIDSSAPTLLGTKDITDYLGDSFTLMKGPFLAYNLQLSGTPVSSDAVEFFSFWSAPALELTGLITLVGQAPLVVLNTHTPLSASFQHATTTNGKTPPPLGLSCMLQFVSVAAVNLGSTAVNTPSNGYAIVSTKFSDLLAYAYVPSLAPVHLRFVLQPNKAGGTDIATLLKDSFPSFSLSTLISKNFPYLQDLVFESLEIEIFRPLNTLSGLDLQVSLPADTEWNLLPKKLSLKHIAARLSVANPLEPDYRCTNLWLSSEGDIFEKKFNAQVELFSLKFSLSMQANQSIELASIFKEVLGTDLSQGLNLSCIGLSIGGSPKGLSFFSGTLSMDSRAAFLSTFAKSFSTIQLPSVSVSDFDVSFHSGDKENDFDFDFIIDGLWHLGIGGLSLDIEEVDIQLTRTQGELGGEISGLINIAGEPFSISASHASPAGGWQFSGNSGSQSISLTHFVTGLLHSFNVTLPAAVPDLTLQNLYVSFDTHTGSFQFKGDTSVPGKVSLGHTVFDVDTTVDIQIDQDAQSGKHTFTGSFEGNLMIGKAEFKVSYEMGKDVHTFNASWESTNDSTLGFNDLADALGITVPKTFSPQKDWDKALKKLDLGLENAVFVYQVDQDTFILSGKSKHYGQAFFVASKPPEEDSWQFVFGVEMPQTLQLSKIPVIGDTLKPVDFLTLTNSCIILSSGEFQHFTIPSLPTLSADNNAQPITPMLEGAQLNLSSGVSFATTIDFKSSKNEVVEKVNSLLGRDELVMQVTIEKNQFFLAATLDGSIGIPTGVSSPLTLSDPSVKIDFISGPPTQVTFQISGSFPFHIDHRNLLATGDLSINETQVQATFGIEDKSGKGLPNPMGLKGVHLDTLDVEMGIFFEPPGLDLGLEGQFHIGEATKPSNDTSKEKSKDKSKDTTDDISDDKFAFVMEIVEEVPNPLYLSFHLAEIDMSTAITAFTDNPAPDVPFFNKLSATDVSFHWAESMVVLPDGTIAQPGFGFNGNFSILGFTAHAALEVDAQEGISGNAEMAPLRLPNLSGIPVVLSLIGDGKGVSVKTDGNDTPISNQQIIRPSPDPSLTTSPHKIIIPPGGPMFSFHSRRFPYISGNWKVSFFDLASEAVTVAIGANGGTFSLRYDLGSIAVFDMHCTLKESLPSLPTDFSAQADCVVGVNTQVGPIIPHLSFTTIHLDVEVDCELDIHITPKDFSMTIIGHFEFEGIDLDVPDLTLNVAPSSLAELPEIMTKHIVKEAETIFKDLFNEGMLILKDVGKEIAKIGEKAGEEIADVGKAAAQVTEEAGQEAVKLGKEATQVATEAAHEVARIGQAADKAFDTATDTAKKIGEDAIAAVNEIGREVVAAIGQLTGEAEAVARQIGAEAVRVAGQIGQEANVIFGTVKQLADAAAAAARKIANAARSAWHHVSHY